MITSCGGRPMTLIFSRNKGQNEELNLNLIWSVFVPEPSEYLKSQLKNEEEKRRSCCRPVQELNIEAKTNL